MRGFRWFLIFVPVLAALLTACRFLPDKSSPTPGPDTTPTPESTPVVVTPTPESTPEPTPTPEPEREPPGLALEQAFDSLKRNDREAVELYMDYGRVAGQEQGTGYDDDNDIRFNDAFFGRLSWTLGEVRFPDEHSAVVEAEIVMVDMESVMSQYVVDVQRMYAEFAAMPEGDKYTQEQEEELLFDVLLQLLKKTPETVATSVEIRLDEQPDGRWRVVVDDTLVGALTGNFDQAVGGV